MYIVATGLVCPIGQSAAAACAAMRARLAAIQELPYFDNRSEPIFGAFVPGIAGVPRGPAQLVEMLVQAISDLQKSQPRVNWGQTPLLVGLAEPNRPGGAGRLADTVVAQVEKALRIRFHQQHSRVFATGHTAAFEGLAEARRLLASDAIETCLVCAVDSYINARSLIWLESVFRLKTAHNRDGIIPGEAAAAVLIGKAAAGNADPEIRGFGFGAERSPVLSEEPFVGLGLAESARTALGEAKLQFHEIDCRLSDVTGELYGFRELALVEGRLMRVVRTKEQPLWHWAEAIGDSGAAAGAAQLVLATEACRKGYAPGPMICLTSSDSGARSAVVLQNGVV